MSILAQLQEWAGSQYEGRPITAAVGLDRENFVVPHLSDVAIDEVWSQPFGPVLSNGLDTMIVVAGNGMAYSLRALDTKEPTPLAPFRYAALAEWSQGLRCAFCLTRTGEILVFSDRALRYARRRTAWHHFTHEAVMAQLDCVPDVSLRATIYESLLDASFARSGACLAILAEGSIDSIDGIVSADDNLYKSAGNSVKVRAIRQLVDSRFQWLDRRVRAELLSLDGATILSHEGNIVAAGAIVRVEAGSPGGGRLAATKTLSKLGVAVKVSQDGKITGYTSGSNSPAFEIG
jgi:hypothetical protein